MEKWFNKVAVVTGASSGMGKSISLKLINQGLRVVGCGRNLDNLVKIKTEISNNSKGEFTPFRCDISKEEDVRNLFNFVRNNFKELSILINNAGVVLDSTILHGKSEDWKKQLDTNVLGMCMCTREAYSLIRANENPGTVSVVPGHIINICSYLGHQVLPYSSMHFYSATKFAVTAITEGIRQELREAKSNIRVTQISPGYVKTEFMSHGLGKQMESTMETEHADPLQASDITAAVVYVLSAEPRAAVHDIIIRSNDDQP